MKNFLKRFELKAISKITAEAIAEREKSLLQKGGASEYAPPAVSLDAYNVMRMLREIEYRRQQSYNSWVKCMAALKRKGR